jgi:hypothetical protein
MSRPRLTAMFLVMVTAGAVQRGSHAADATVKPQSELRIVTASETSATAPPAPRNASLRCATVTPVAMPSAGDAPDPASVPANAGVTSLSPLPPIRDTATVAPSASAGAPTMMKITVGPDRVAPKPMGSASVMRATAYVPRNGRLPDTNVTIRPVAAGGVIRQVANQQFSAEPASMPNALRPMNELTTDISTSSGPMPRDESGALEVGTYNPLDYTLADTRIAFQWESPVIWHGPLYFEDVPTEHFGQTHGRVLQPFVSAGRFICQTIMLPYKVALDPPCSRIYNLRDLPTQNTPMPQMRQWLPVEIGPALAEAAVLAPIFIFIP